MTFDRTGARTLPGSANEELPSGPDSATAEQEPAPADLAVLVAGEPLVAAEVALVDAESGLVAAVESWLAAFRRLARLGVA